MTGKTARAGRDRTAAYRQRLATSGEPPAYVVANATVAALIEARMNRESGLDPAEIIERAAEIVVADARFTQEGFDNVLSRFTQPGNRRRRLA
jgi:hypothetical protein